HLPRASHGNRDVQGAGQYPGKKTWRHSRRTTETLFGLAVARPRSDRHGDCTGRTLSLLGHVQRHRRAISQRGWRRRVFLMVLLKDLLDDCFTGMLDGTPNQRIA